MIDPPFLSSWSSLILIVIGENAIVFHLFVTEGIWKCRHCNWTHQIGSPCPLDIQNPKGYLNMALDTQTLYQWDWGPCFTLEAKGQ